MKIIGIYTGKPKNLSKNFISAINRVQQTSKVQLSFHQLEGDEVADKEHHGGDNRVIHQYALESYAFFQEQYPAQAALFVPGSIGENIISEHWNDANVCIGDVFQLGTCKLQVTEPRKPCRTIDMKYGIKGIARKIQEHQKTGWFFKVLEEGSFDSKDEMIRLENKWPKLTVAKVTKELLVERKNSTMLKELSEHPVLSDNWRKPAQLFLEKGQYKSDTNRLGEV